MSIFPQTEVPVTIPGCRLWLDAADTSTITQSSGAVSLWRDKSGRGANAAQTTGANQPTTNSVTIAGNNVIGFTGSPQIMTFADNSFFDLPTNVFIVAQPTDFISVTAQSIFGRVSAGPPIGTYLNIWVPSVSRIRLQLTDGSGVSRTITDTTNVSASVPFIMHTNTVIGSPASVSLNNRTPTSSGVNVVATTNDPANLTRIGGRAAGSTSSFFIGYICEFIVYNSDLSNANKTIIVNYLSKKWGVTIL